MQPGLYSKPRSSLRSVLLLLSFLTFAPFCSASVIQDLQSNYFDPAPAPQDGPTLSAGALRDTAYLPAQIGGLVGSYALSLVIVAAALLILAKKRREHLNAGEDDLGGQVPYPFAFPPVLAGAQYPQYGLDPPKSPVKNFSYPTPQTPLSAKSPTSFYIAPSLHSTSTLGVNPLVDPRVVAADREMAQQQLEEMYRLVMEQEAAKEAGVALEQPPAPLSQPPPKQGILKRGKNKPAILDLAGQEKTQSRASSILSAFKSPRKKNAKGISISSPIMTPMSGTFPRHEEEEMSAIPPRQYAPASPPPVPTDQVPYARASRHHGQIAPITPPDISPESTQSIDERLGHMRSNSQYTEPDPVSAISAVSDRSTAPLVGLPSSPKPGVNRFPSLPASPKPGATFPISPRPEQQSFSRPNAPSAVRTGGALPLRAYEPALSSPSAQTTKQTTFERAMPLSPSGLRTPWTGAPVPYTPYQPFSPVVPITPSLVTKADRKRMKQLQPKTPTMEMVKSDDEMW
ncbi:Clr6 histone deacetylase associated PHD protein-2 Cph2 [Hypoxylon texense]